MPTLRPRRSDPELRDAVLAVLAIAMAPAVGLGVARFAYALVLPDMQAAFGWSYATAGLPNALNALGYLVGALTAAPVAARTGLLRLVVWSTLAAALTTALSAFAMGLVSLSALRFVAGVAAAFGLVAGGAIAISFAGKAGSRGSLVVALFYVGPPVGILVSACVAPLALQADWAEGWRAAWGALGCASFALALAFLAAPLRRAQAAAAEGDGERARAPLLACAPLLLGYALYGAGYIAYMTFMIAFLRGEGAGLARESAFWSTIGLTGIASAWLWSGVLARLKGGRGAGAAALVTTLGASAPLAAGGFAAQIVSGAVFGLGMFATVAATSVFVRRNMAPAEWASGVGAMTVAFSLGQTIGPVLTGFVTDAFGGLAAGLGLGAALLDAGALLCAAQGDLAAAGGPAAR